jgi:hypothetical protein
MEGGEMIVRNPRSTLATVAVLAVTSLAMGGAATPAGAAPTNAVPPGTTICTSQLRADAGAVLSGSVTRNTSGALWTVRVAASAGGAENEVLRTPTGPVTFQVNGATVVPPVAGTWFFRGCVRTTGPLNTAVRIQLSPV